MTTHSVLIKWSFAGEEVRYYNQVHFLDTTTMAIKMEQIMCNHVISNPKQDYIFAGPLMSLRLLAVVYDRTTCIH